VDIPDQPFDPSTKSVVVIDDVEDLAATMVLLLELGGYVAQYALTGATGLELVGRISPDAVLLDFVLPDMTGAEVARALRREAATSGIKILMCTSTLEETVRPQFSDYAAFLEKPVAHSRLMHELQGALVGR
jgi:CheY-like chemotaxis protein